MNSPCPPNPGRAGGWGASHGNKPDELVKSHQTDGKVKSSPPEADRWTFYEAIKPESEHKKVIRAVTEVLLFGSLWREGQQFPTRQVQVELQTPTPLPDLLERLHIGTKQVQLAMVNHRAVPPDHMVQPGDRVSLFPREYPVFADWKNFRS